jgi:hypothetical protein
MRAVTVCSALVAMVSFVTTACMLPAPPSTEPARGAESPARQNVPGEVIVQFRVGTSKERIHEVIAATGASVEKDLGTPLIYLVRFSEERPIDQLLACLRGFPEVLHAEANRVIRIEPPRPIPGTKPAPVGK